MIYYLVNSGLEVNVIEYDGSSSYSPPSGWQLLHQTGYDAWRQENPAPTPEPVTLSGAGASIYYSDNAPSGATDGQLWFNSSDGHTYINYRENADASQWVSINATLPVGATYMSATEPTGSGVEVGQTWFDTTTNINYVRYSGAQGLAWASNADTVDGNHGFYYRNIANITGTAALSGTFTGTFTGTASNASNLNNQSAAYYLNAGNLSGSFTGTANNATNLNSQAASYYLNAANLTGLLALARLPVAADNTSTSTGIVRADDTRLSNSRAPTSHTHPISDVTNLQTTLDAKGTVSGISIVSANGISGSIANSTTTPAITLSLGSITPSNIDLSTQYKQAIVTVTTNGTSIDCSLGNYFTTTVSSSLTYTFSNAPASRSYSFILEVNHTSGSIAWPNSVTWPAGTAPTLTTGKTHLFGFITDDGGTKWRGCSSINYTT